MELSMIYEIEQEGECQKYSIRRQGTGYAIGINDAPEILVQLKDMNGIYNLLVNGKSFDAGCLQHESVVEVEVAGERHLINVYDPRKKALRLADSGGEGLIQTQMPGRIVDICVSKGDVISKGQIVIIVEAMKMENPLKATKDGIVADVFVSQGELVEAKTKLVLIE
jgi:biotin carboxyl carrier protein